VIAVSGDNIFLFFVCLQIKNKQNTFFLEPAADTERYGNWLHHCMWCPLQMTT